MGKRLLWLLLLLTVASDAAADACYWNGSKYNATCFACQPTYGLPDWWRAQYCGGVQTCQPRVETKVDACPVNQVGSITSTRNITCANPYQETVGDWYVTSNTCQPICQIRMETRTQSCPSHYSGSITQVRQTSCPSGAWGDWVTTSNTCQPDPPTCKPSTESQTLSCPTGYTGSITQTRTLTCPDPYGSPVASAWTTTSDTCVKSLTNPTNVSSPVSPISPISPTATTVTAAPVVSAPAPVIAAPTLEVSTSVDTTASSSSTESTQSSGTASSSTTGAPAPAAAAPASSSQPKTDKAPPPKGKTLVGGFGLVMSMELFIGPSIKQYDALGTFNITQELPNEIKRRNELLLDLIEGSASGAGDYLYRRSDDIWGGLHRDNEIQRGGFDY